MGRLLEGIVSALGGPPLEHRHDGAVLALPLEGGDRAAFTTDSYVVSPLFFPGGDIGKLAVYGTVNDLAMCGARPAYLSVGMILEEGLPWETLERVVESLREAADRAGVYIVTGDTKVVDKGKGDGLFLNTAGLGIVPSGVEVRPSEVRPGDVVLLSGDLGRHGIAILATREGLEFETAIESDCAPLHEPVLRLLAEGVEVHCMRDLTRGGLASALLEIAQSTQLHIEIEETAIPVRPEVQAACELLGLDPLYVANEGRWVTFVPEGEAERALTLLRDYPVSAEACAIGRVLPASEALGGLVTLRTAIGTTRTVDWLSGEQLPRIC